MAAPYTFKVRFMDDRDPFTVAYAEPTVPPTFVFLEDEPLIEQIPRLIKVLNAPHQVEEASLQVSIDNSYLDLDSTIVDLCEGGSLDPCNRKTILILRTSLSVRVHNCCEKLHKSSGRDLRKALFSLKRIFKDDQDLVHCFVGKGGLDTLVSVGEDADHNYIIYIIRALGEVMVYVDGMQGIIQHHRTIQWLYVLITKYGNKSIMLVKGCLELLLVFINYKEDTNSILVVKAIHTVDLKHDRTPWNAFMAILKEGLSNPESYLYSITLINKVLCNVGSQDMFYDITDALEAQGIEQANKEVLEKDVESEVVTKIKLQINAYNAQLKAEDDENSDPTDPKMPNKKGRRASAANGPTKTSNLLNITAHAQNIRNQEKELGIPEEEEVMVTPKIVENGGDGDWAKRAEIMDSSMVPPPPPQKNDAARIAMIQERREKAEKRLRRRRTLLNIKHDDDKHVRDDKIARQFVDNIQKSRQTNVKSSFNEKEGEMIKTSNSWTRLKSKIDVIKNMRKPDPPIETGKIRDEKPEVVREASVLEEELESSKPGLDLASLARPTTFTFSSSLAIKSHNFADLCDKDDFSVKTVIETKPAQPVAPAAPGIPGAPRPPGAPPAPPGAPRAPGAPPPPPAPPGAPRPPGAPPPAPRPPGAPPAPRPPGAPPAPRPPGAPPAPGAPPVPGGTGTLKKVPNKSDLVKVFWTKINLNKSTGLPSSVPQYAAPKLDSDTLWKSRPEVKVDYDQLAALFTKKKLETKKSQDSEPKQHLKFITVLSGNRSKEVGIAMAKLPASRHIKQAIMNLDMAHITRESIQALTKLVPTDEEKNQITEAKLANPNLPLGKEEDYVYTLSVIPNIRCRLNIWAFMIDFDTMEDQVADYLMDLKECCNELRNCKTLHLIISYLLEIGNFLRQETSDGFDLSFLSKVADIKDTVKKQTLIHHIACMMHANHPNQGDLHKEIGHTHRTGRISFEEVETTMQQMDEECDKRWDDLRTISKHASNLNDNIMQRQLTFLRSVAERIEILKIIMKRVTNRYYSVLLYFGIDPVKKFIPPNELCRIISEFALEYRTAIEAVIQEQAKKKKMRERKKTRGIKITDLKNIVTGGSTDNTNSSRKSSDRSESFNDPKDKKKLLAKTKSKAAETPDTPEEVALSLESALQADGPNKRRTRTRLKSKMAQRKSLRRTIKNGITEEELVAAGIK